MSDKKKHIEQWLIKDTDNEYTIIKADHWECGGNGLKFFINDEKVAHFIRWASYRKLNTYELKKGKALLICGAQGSGKTALAIKIAKKHGDFKTIEYTQLETGLYAALENEPETLIIEEFLATKSNLNFIKHFITNHKTVISQEGKETLFIKTPNFILCTGNADAIPVSKNSRRFTVVKI